jgi:hypothetical protein
LTQFLPFVENAGDRGAGPRESKLIRHTILNRIAMNFVSVESNPSFPSEAVTTEAGWAYFVGSSSARYHGSISFVGCGFDGNVAMTSTTDSSN